MKVTRNVLQFYEVLAFIRVSFRLKEKIWQQV